MTETTTEPLDEIGRRCNTDKASHHHGYLKVYEKYFEQFRDKNIIVLEAGFGGYHYPDRGGESVRMWHEYFPNAEIISIDFYHKIHPNLERLRLYQCSQDDPVGLQNIVYENGNPDIIIDDASHVNPMTIRTFEILFPLLKEGGIFVVEDAHTSYWPDHGYNGNRIPGEKGTAWEYFADLSHQLNHHAFEAEYHHPFKDMIEWIHFYKQLIFVSKSK